MTPEEAREAFMAAMRDPDASSISIGQDILLEQGWKLWEMGEWAQKHGKVPSHFGDDDVEGKIVSHGMFALKKNYSAEWIVTAEELPWGGTPLPPEEGHEYRALLFVRFEEFQDASTVIPPISISDGRYWPELESARIEAAKAAWAELALIKRGYRERWSGDRFNRATPANMEIPAEINPAKMSPKQAFWNAVADPDPSSMEVAQDIALEQGWKLWQMGEQRSKEVGSGWIQKYPNVGGFWYTTKEGYENGCEWKITDNTTYPSGKKRSKPTYDIEIFFEYQDADELEQWEWESSGIYETVEDAARNAARYCWWALSVMKNGSAEKIDSAKVVGLIQRAMPGDVPPELNPAKTMTKNPDDLAAARKKYLEFHRYDPKDVGSFPSSFTIPKKMLCAGKGKWVTYRSSKVDPSTLKKPKRPIDYIHEHDAGVMTYLADEYPDTEVPEKFRDVSALVRLGQCLGFCIVDVDGDDVEAEGTEPLPELYCSPDGKCLYVIQDKKKVIAMSWGGALGVFARGIDG